MAPAPLSAQGGVATASVAGRATDETGAILPGVTVTVTNQATNQSRMVVTDSGGVYRFSGLTPSTYSVTAELQGFALLNIAAVSVNVGRAVDLNLVLRLSSIQESITVTSQAPIVESAKTDFSTVISQDQIETLPANSRNYLDFALITPAIVENFSTTAQGVGVNIGGARAKEGSLLVDGFWNTDESSALPRQQYSQDAIQEFQVISLGATAESGRAIGGIVSAVTKSGGNALAGSGYGFFRDTRLNAQAVLERQRGLPKSEFDRKLWGGSLGGPIVRDRTFFFGAAERKDQNTPIDNNITAANGAAIGLPPEDVGTIPGYIKTTFAMGKVSHSLNPNHTLHGAFVFTKHVDYNASQFQSFGTRSRMFRLGPKDWSYQVFWTGVGRDGNWLHELKGSYFPRDYPVDFLDVGGQPLVPEGQLRENNSPNVNITGVANFGGGGVLNHQETFPAQVIYTSTISKNTHNIKFGADAMYVKFDYERPGTPTYSFRNLAAFLQGQYTTYTQMFGDPFIQRRHSYMSAFIQDSWAIHPRVTLNYGLRYDAEILSKYHGASFGEDFNNFGPRAALSYDLTGRGQTIAKVSFGMLYDRIFQNPITPTFFSFKEVRQQVSATWLFGQPGAPVYPNTYPSDRPPASAPAGVLNVTIMPDELEVPRSDQLVVSLDHAFAHDISTTVSFLYNRSHNKEIPFDRNLRFDDATERWVRPDPQYRQITQYTFTGRAEYTGLALEFRKRLSNNFGLGGNLTLSRAYDQNNNFSVGPNDQRFPELEWGPSADVPKVRYVVDGSYQVGPAQVSLIYRGRSGYNFDPRTGNTFDVNQDGQFNDRTPGFERNAFRGPDNHTVDTRFTWAVPLRDVRLQLMLEAFNLLNRENTRAVFTTYGPTPGSPDPLFLTPLNYFPPREIQLGIRVVF
ncbi:MAG: TonB-dependent receptor [Vicinamibacterales bacterium]